jgi:hypothetical protein
MLDTEYRNNPAVSQSFLKDLEGFPKYLTLREKKKSAALDMGSLIDVLLTDPYNFDNYYVVYDKSIPTDKLKLLADKYIEICLYDKELGIETNHINTVLQARQIVEYDARLTATTIMDRFDKECYEYTQFVLTTDKMVVSHNDYLVASDLATSCRYDERLSKWFEPNKDVTILYQQSLFFTYKHSLEGLSIDCKALPDLIYINHLDKTVQIVDIKSYEGDFEVNYYKYRYYYQAMFYLMAAQLRSNETLIPKDYKIEDFYFIAIDKSKFKGNILYKFDRKNFHTVQDGGKLYDSKGHCYKIKGLRQLLKEYDYHSRTGNWEYPYEYLTKGMITL